MKGLSLFRNRQGHWFKSDRRPHSFKHLRVFLGALRGPRRCNIHDTVLSNGRRTRDDLFECVGAAHCRAVLRRAVALLRMASFDEIVLGFPAKSGGVSSSRKPTSGRTLRCWHGNSEDRWAPQTTSRHIGSNSRRNSTPSDVRDRQIREPSADVVVLKRAER